VPLDLTVSEPNEIQDTSNGCQKVGRGLTLQTIPSLVNEVLLGSLNSAKVDLTTLVKNRHLVEYCLLDQLFEVLPS
jgi:hypothetical protein